jgi:transposase
MKLRDVL